MSDDSSILAGSSATRETGAREVLQGWFAFAWALATLFHLRLPQVSPWILSGTSASLAIAALLVCARPRSARLLALLCTVQLVDFLAASPTASNHHTLQAVVASTVLAVLGTSARAQRPFVVALPRIRWSASRILAVLYFWGFLHKLNTAFLDPAVSCATELTAGLMGDAAYRELFAALAIGGTLGLEGVAAVLIATRWWPLAVLVATPFHFIVGFTGFAYYMDFSAVVLALFVVLLPASVTASLEKRLGCALPAISGWASHWWIAARLGLVFALGLPVAAHRLASDGERLLPHQLAWAAYGGLLTLLLLIAAVFGLCAERSLQQRSLAGATAATCLFLMGLSPYIGWRTEASLAMYSNLRTEGSSNHLLIPREWQLLDLQDPVEVIETNVPSLQRYLEDRSLAPTRYGFWTHMRSAIGLPRATYRIGDVIETFDAEIDPEIPYRSSWFTRHFARFRVVYLEDPRPCAH